MDVSEFHRLILNIGAGYGAFLKEGGLKDAPLARMTYFHTVRTVYVEDPIVDVTVQAEILEKLDSWIHLTQREMESLMR